jgi:predicted nucleic acid-binding protein
VDASALIALADRSDTLHETARRYDRGAGRKAQLFTSLFVLDEVATRLRAAAGAAVAVRAVSAVLESPRFGVLEVDRALFLEALHLLAHYGEHRLSLTDCTSFLVMRRLALTDAFTFDADFARAGFAVHPGR